MYGNYNVSDMTPRKWSGANSSVTINPSSRPISDVTRVPTLKILPTIAPSTKVTTSQPVAMVTSNPTLTSSSKPTSSPSTAPSVFVNEVADKGDYTVCGGSAGVAGRDWVELYNSAGESVDISGWKIHDDHGPDYIQAYIIPAGTILAPYSYAIFCQADSFQFGIGGYVIYE